MSDRQRINTLERGMYAILKIVRMQRMNSRFKAIESIANDCLKRERDIARRNKRSAPTEANDTLVFVPSEGFKGFKVYP